jgi:oligopeptidase B
VDGPTYRGAGAAPVARRAPGHVRSAHGSRTDDYGWLRDDTRESAEVLAHLAAENDYADRYFAPLAPLVAGLAAELRARLVEDEASVPVWERGYWYYVRYEPGREYPIHARRAGSLDAPEEVLLDVNELARGHDYYALGSLEVSDDNTLLAYTEDTVGRLEYTLKVRTIATGADVGVAVFPVEDGIAWAADNATILYVLKDRETLLGNEVRAVDLGSGRDRLLYAEDDPSFFLGVYRGRSRRFLYVVAQSTVTSEYRYAPANDPYLVLSVVCRRERGHEYHVDDCQRDGLNAFLVVSNDGAPNFRVLEAPLATLNDRTTWTERLAERADVLVTGVDTFADFFVVSERVAAGPRLRVITETPSGVPTGERLLAARDAVGVVGLDDNPEFATATLRYVESSPQRPDTTVELDLATGSDRTLKVEPVPGADPSAYAARLLYAPARDGARIPVTVIRRRELAVGQPAPLYQTAYGAYGISSDATFSVARLSLLDRGFVCAIAHVRGGQEQGRAWYDAGRLANKRNSFNDFIDVTRFLVEAGIADPARLFGAGGSAGGLLVAAVTYSAGYGSAPTLSNGA